MTWLAQTALGLVLAAVAVTCQVVLAGAGLHAPLLLAYPSVIAAAWWGGAWAGGAAALGNALGLAYFVFPPAASFAIDVERDVVDLVIFCALSALVVYGVARVRRALGAAHAARAAAESATAARDTMVAVVAHDLRNPLQTIGLNADLLASLWGRDVRTTAAIARLRRSVELSRRLVDNILDTARVGEAFPLDLAPSPVHALVAASVEPFEPLAAARAIHFTWQVDDDDEVVCDRERVVQVLTALLSNAFQFTPRGGTVSLEARRAQDGVRFAVSDTGVGIPKDELPHIFERLWHGRRPGHGSGLGLWIAQAVIEAHGARITASSEVGAGTTMSFVLPRPSPAPRRAPIALAPAPA